MEDENKYYVAMLHLEENGIKYHQFVKNPGDNNSYLFSHKLAKEYLKNTTMKNFNIVVIPKKNLELLIEEISKKD